MFFDNAPIIIIVGSPTDAEDQQEYIKDINKSLSDYASKQSLAADKSVNDVVKAVDFSSDTDARCYLASPSEALSSVDQQNAVYLLSIRNLLLIFLLIFCVYLASKMIRKVIFNYFKK